MRGCGNKCPLILHSPEVKAAKESVRGIENQTYRSLFFKVYQKIRAEPVRTDSPSFFKSGGHNIPWSVWLALDLLRINGPISPCVNG
jgi:hypothetical protein